MSASYDSFGGLAMTNKISKSNDDLAYFNGRLDEVRMTSHERLRAKAHLARAEAMADLVAWAFSGIARLFKHEPARINHPAASAG
jgi:hypothetical protein